MKSKLMLIMALMLVVSMANSQDITVEDLYTMGSASVGGWVVKDSTCGCPTGNKTIACKDDDAFKWPTRCLKENLSGRKRYACYKTRRMKEAEKMLYPEYKYPKGYPAGLAGRRAGQKIPFPGWPAEKKTKDTKVSKWTTISSLRQKYQNRIEVEGKAPGKVDQDYADKSNLNWGANWQIHHILEQKHNGTDIWGNMVPVHMNKQTNKNSINFHQQYTNFWQRVKVDHQFAGNNTTWDKIKVCVVKKWPKTSAQQVDISTWVIQDP